MRGTLFATTGLFACLMTLTPAASESFDYDGRAVIACTCPSPSQAGNCAFAGRQPWNYAEIIFVKPALSIDENEICYRKRDTTLCCPDGSAKFKGRITKRCRGNSPC